MNRLSTWLVAALAIMLAAPWALAQQPAYTLQEYNAYQAAANEQNPQQRVRLLNEFAQKFPQSTLMPYAYRLYLATYNQLGEHAKTIEYADRILALGEQVDAGGRLEAIYTRSLAFHQVVGNRASPDQLRRAREAAQEGLKILNELPKPESLTAEQFAEQKRAPAALFHYTAGYAAMQLKDYRTALADFHKALEFQPNDPVTYFRIGVAHLSLEPPQLMDGFWALARSVALKGPGEAQVRDYLRAQLRRYQQLACEAEGEKYFNELLGLAAGSPSRPPNYRIPSGEQIRQAAAEAENFVTVLAEGGERAQLVWLASCGLAFPEFVVKVLLSEPEGDALILQAYGGGTPEEIEAAESPNMRFKVEGQPEVARLRKNDLARISGTLIGWNREPFHLRWEKARVNPEDIVEEGQPAKAPSKRPGKRP